MKKLIILLVAVVIAAMAFSGCDTDAQVASRNVSLAADQFEVFRRVIFYNVITGDYILEVDGYSSITVDNIDHQLELTVKVGPGVYLKHFLGLCDNATYFVEQLEPTAVSDKRYKVIFKPSTIVPTIRVE